MEGVTNTGGNRIGKGRVLKKDQGATKELNGSSDCAQAAGTVSRHSEAAQEMLVELNLKQVFGRPPAPPPSLIHSLSLA